MCDKYWSGGALKGYDKEGGPVWILPIGNFDPKGQKFINMLTIFVIHIHVYSCTFKLNVAPVLTAVKNKLLRNALWQPNLIGRTLDRSVVH